MKKYNNFHSNYNEDQWISTNLQLPEEGIFVDVGACDAITRSNTYHFEMNGWTGFLPSRDQLRIKSYLNPNLHCRNDSTHSPELTTQLLIRHM